MKSSEKDKKFLMRSGVLFFALLFFIIWLLNLNNIFSSQDTAQDNAFGGFKNDISETFNDFGDDLEKTTNEIDLKKEVEKQEKIEEAEKVIITIQENLDKKEESVCDSEEECNSGS